MDRLKGKVAIISGGVAVARPFAAAEVDRKVQVEAAVATVKAQLGPVNVLFNTPAPSSSNRSWKPRKKIGTSCSM